MNMEKIAEGLRKYRKQAGLSQDELAEKLHVTRQAVSRWESGSAMPSVDNLMELAAIFGVTVDELLQQEPAPAAPALRAETVGALLDEQARQQHRRMNRLTLVLVLVALLLAGAIGVTAWLNGRHISTVQAQMGGLQSSVNNISAVVANEVQSAVQSALDEGTSLLTDAGVRSWHYDADAQAFLADAYAYPREASAQTTASFRLEFSNGQRYSFPAAYEDGAFRATLSLPDSLREQESTAFMLYLALNDGSGEQLQRIGVEAVDVQRLLPSVMDRSAWSWSSLSNQATVTLAAYVTPAEDTAVASLKASIYSTAGKLLGESELHVTNAYEEPQLWQGDIQSFANTKSDGVSIVYRLTDVQGHTFYFKEDKMLDGMPE